MRFALSVCMKYLSLLLFLPLGAFAQTRTVTDGGRKFAYSDTAGVTASYVRYFGSTFNPGALKTVDGRLLPAPDSGEIVVYNFWFVACPPCVAEIPVLNRVAAAYKDAHVRFVGITWDAPSRVQAFLGSHPFGFDLVSLNRVVVDSLKKVSLYPCTVVVDHHGRVSFVLFGRTKEEGLEEVLKVQVDRAMKR
jgi:cytochrome c biogenesis protein CcmG/thiol:disulfide interchange protein DsbE